MKDAAYWLSWVTSEWVRILPVVYFGVVLANVSTVAVLVAVANWQEKRRRKS